MTPDDALAQALDYLHWPQHPRCERCESPMLATDERDRICDRCVRVRNLPHNDFAERFIRDELMITDDAPDKLTLTLQPASEPPHDDRSVLVWLVEYGKQYFTRSFHAPDGWRLGTGSDARVLGWADVPEIQERQ